MQSHPKRPFLHSVGKYKTFLTAKNSFPTQQRRYDDRREEFSCTLFLCFLSALLLILAFPKTDFWILAWVGLVPLFFALDGKSPRAAFATAYLCGVMVFTGTLYWFVHVTLLGLCLLMLYLALFYGLFGVLYARFSHRKLREQLWLLPGGWIVLEFARAHLFTGFGWVSLGYSQYKNLLFIQIADTVGMYGVSFLIVLANVWLKKVIEEKLSGEDFLKNRELRNSGIILAGILGCVAVYGVCRLSPPGGPIENIKIAVVQGNIPQAMKWDEALWPEIMEKHWALTQEAAAEKPDLILWPETAFPGFVWATPQRFAELKNDVARLGIPLLFGVVTKKGRAYYNSAILLSADGEITGQYDKLHLVPFGEYVPLRGYLPILTDIVPIDDFTAGKEFTSFSVDSNGRKNKNAPKFSVLICFEDAVTDIAREFTRGEADFLVNITNDAWFMDSKAPFMHVQASVFRAVENRRPLVRSANTGVSCFVDSYGRIHDCVQDESGKKTFVSGTRVSVLKIVDGPPKTFYTKFGDFFTYLCFGCILWGIIIKK